MEKEQEELEPGKQPGATDKLKDSG